jgi:hypothetical protein
MNGFSPTYYDVHWYGPFALDELSISEMTKTWLSTWCPELMESMGEAFHFTLE